MTDPLRDAPNQNVPQRELTLFDSTCLIVGIVVGAGIYQMAPDIAKGAYCWWGVLLIWAVGGLISLCGALGYAELGSAYPHQGGDYVYLSRAYGRWAGFLFGWLQLAVVRPGDIVVMAFAFAMYARAIYDPMADTDLASSSQQIYAAAAVVVLTAINILGVRQGKWTQNLLTVVKALGLLAIVGVALFAPAGAGSAAKFEPLPISVALILVLFTFGGWNEVAYVAAELKDPKRNILRALVLGIAIVTIALRAGERGVPLRARLPRHGHFRKGCHRLGQHGVPQIRRQLDQRAGLYLCAGCGQWIDLHGRADFVRRRRRPSGLRVLWPLVHTNRHASSCTCRAGTAGPDVDRVPEGLCRNDPLHSAGSLHVLPGHQLGCHRPALARTRRGAALPRDRLSRDDVGVRRRVRISDLQRRDVRDLRSRKALDRARAAGDHAAWCAVVRAESTAGQFSQS